VRLHSQSGRTLLGADLGIRVSLAVFDRAEAPSAGPVDFDDNEVA